MKKFLAIALSVMMLVGLVPFAAFTAMAADADFVFDFEASATEVKAGDVVDVTVNVTGAEGAETAGWQFELVLPEGLEYVDGSAVVNAETKSKINAGEFSFENSTKVMVCCEANGVALANMAGTNEIMTFQLKVADDAAAGEELTFELLDFLVMDGEGGELDMDKVELNIDTLTVVVDPDFTFDFTASKTNVVAGEEVEFTLDVTGVEGAETAGWQFELVLPEGLEYVDGSAVVNAETKANINAGEFSFENSTLVMVCCEANGVALANMAGTNEIMTFTLKVADDAVAGDEYTFELLDFLVMDGEGGEMDMSLVKLNIDTLTIVDHICSADKLTFVPAAEPTCTDDGNVAYYVCECGIKYGDADAKQPAGDTIVPATGHIKTDAVKENEKAADCDDEGSYDEVVYCEVCGEEMSRNTITVDALGHTAAEAVEENRVEATCTEDGSYEEVVYCEVCGEEMSREEITIDALGHDYEEDVTDPTCTEDGYTTHTCTVCGDEYVDTYVDALGHTEDDVTYENVSDATCTEGGTGDAVIYCAVCGEELSRVTSTVPALGHTPGEEVEENREEADCVNDGSYDTVVYCEVCGEELSRETTTIDALGHTAGEEVEENREEADCVNDGSYDTVVYCEVCGEELSRETTTIDALGHTAGEEVEENREEADCVNDGSYDTVVYCEVCGEELSRETTTIDALGHTAGEEVEENRNEATCTEDGSFDTVVYCTVCGEELSRETTTLEATGHDYEPKVTDPTCTEAGYTTYTCTVCGDSYKADEVAAIGHDIPAKEEWVESATEKGTFLGYCKNECGYYESEVRAVPAEEIKLDQDDVEVYYVRKAPAFTLTETVLPEDKLLLDYEVIWSSDNEKVATVDEDGNVTTHKLGCATITATLVDAEGNVIDTAECNVKVKYTWWQWLIWFFLIGCAWYFV